MQEAKLNLGKVVRIARKRKRITQDYLAERVGVQPRTILEIENGRGNPRFENLFVMVRLLDIAPNDIFNYDCGLAQDTEQLFQELSSFSEEEQRMAAAAARAVLQQRASLRPQAWTAQRRFCVLDRQTQVRAWICRPLPVPERHPSQMR